MFFTLWIDEIVENKIQTNIEFQEKVLRDKNGPIFSSWDCIIFWKYPLMGNLLDFDILQNMLLVEKSNLKTTSWNVLVSTKEPSVHFSAIFQGEIWQIWRLTFIFPGHRFLGQMGLVFGIFCRISLEGI